METGGTNLLDEICYSEEQAAQISIGKAPQTEEYVRARTTDGSVLGIFRGQSETQCGCWEVSEGQGNHSNQSER